MKPYKTIELRPEGIVILSMILTGADVSDFIEWHEIDTPTKLLGRLVTIGGKRWASAWTLREIALAARRHFGWEIAE